jgi:hypothetical protein
MKYQPSERAAQLIKGLFTFHPVHGDQGERYSAIRSKALELAELIVGSTPESAEQTLALRALHLCTMQANAAIAVNEKPDEDRVSN